MSFRAGFCCARFVLSMAIVAIAIGCASTPPPLSQARPYPTAAAPAPQIAAAPALAAQVAYHEAPEPLPATEVVDFPAVPQGTTVAGEAPPPGSELVLDLFVEDVLQRNRSLQAMVATWQAATERYPQAIALDDLMFNSTTAPASWRSSQVTPAYIVGGSQKIPWMGKRKLRGQVAENEANAVHMEVAEARLQLIQAAQIAFFEYYLVHRQLELNASNNQSLREFRDTARRNYEANLVAQQDVLQGEVELADLTRRRVELERMNHVAIARINTLMHRPPDAPIPPPPAGLPLMGTPAPVEFLRQAAIAQRPDLSAIGARISGDRAALALAYKEFYPDFDVMGQYDSFWQPYATQKDLRAQLGVNMNVPIYLEKRRAAAREAMFKLRQRQAEFEQRIDDINNEVQTAYERVLEMSQVVDLYANQTLPASRQNVESARADYIAGRGDFLRLVSAQRQLIELRERHQQAIAEYHSRWADLQRAVAGPIPVEAMAEPIAPPVK